MSKHTPGPWFACQWKHSRQPEIAIKSTAGQWIGDVVVDIDHHNESSDEQEANARLIAAAPELLSALRGLLPMWESGISEPWVLAARAAIAKAEGEGE